MKSKKVLHWFPDPKNSPDLFAEVRYPRKKKKTFDIMNVGDYVDLTNDEARELLGPVVFAGRFKVAMKEAR